MAAPDLTTDTAVKLQYGKTGSGDDAILAVLIPAVSRQFEKFVGGRTLAQVAGVERKYRPGPLQTVIVLDQWPNDNVAVTQDDTVLVLDTDFEVLDDRRLVRISGNRELRWIDGANVVVTSDEGYADADIPEDLAQACNEQVVFSFRQTGSSGRLGKTDRDGPEGTSEGWVPYDLLESVKSVLEGYKRFA